MKTSVSLFILGIAALLWSAKVHATADNFRLAQAVLEMKQKSIIIKERREYKFVKKSGRLSIDMGNVKIEGYNGNEVIISKLVEVKEVDERAVGLRGISALGIGDNTDMGIHISNKGDLTEIRLTTFHEQDSILIKVPKNLALSVKNNQPMTSDGTIRINDMQGEIEVSSTLGNVKLDNVSGPMTIRTVNGNVEAVFKAPVKGPISIFSTLGFIDVALPAKTAADLQMSTSLGNLYAAEDFNIEIVPQGEEEKRVIIVSKSDRTTKVIEKVPAIYPTHLDSIEDIVNNSLKAVEQSLGHLSNENIIPKNLYFNYKTGNRVQGKINGGGENIILRTTNGTVYLRTTK